MEEDFSAPFSWWSDSHNRPHQSPWLQAILSDLDHKVKTIVNLIQDDGDSFTERAEMFYKRRPDLLKILKELQESYCLLAEKFDRLRSPSSIINTAVNTRLQDTDQTSPIFKNLNMEQHIDIDAATNEGIENNGGDNLRRDGAEEEKIWSGLRLTVSKLIEDNRRQQAELIRRNDEKREVIKQLREQISRLMEENRALMGCAHVDLKRICEHNNVSKLKGLNCIGRFRDL
ncbi:protein NETWORKED 3A [Ricinus communis]|uniref:NAB domain-containing protein n=1 Tax=Ricinus communis TaxID=3988 RepID=B9RFY2_RICCO|nr:protein NETWORKED 3A [Ricinus communis]XP_015570449.1 protein NETWORKED 3A [Ricinus communis]EEF50103.1 conserved hypothetical protein [Ricinus communis]|eukprot:XP_002512651.1 protein NETWORKED 3A [Ricinus communis]